MSTAAPHPFLRFLSYAKPYKWRIFLAILGGIVMFGFPMATAWLMKVLVDRVIPEADRQLLLAVALGLFGIHVGRSLTAYWRGMNMVKLNSRMVFDIRQDLWEHLQRLSLKFHQRRPSGSLLSRLMGDVGAAQRLIGGGVIGIVIDLGCGTAAAAVLFSMNWQMGLLVFAVLPMYGLLYKRMNPKIRKASHALREQTAVMSGTAVERLSGMAVVQSFAQEKAEAESFAEQSEELKDQSVHRGRLNHQLKVVSQFLIGVGGHSLWIVGALLATNTALPPDRRMTVGDIILFTSVAAHLYGPIKRLSDINVVYQDCMASVERIFRLFDRMPAIQNRPGARKAPPAEGRIQFDRVSFRYGRDAPDVLRRVSFTVEPGRKVAVVGESGAGKSTLVSLVPRLYDVTDGAIRIDGVDVRDYVFRQLRRSIGIVLQDTILFSGTVRENLLYGRKDAREADLVSAAKSANAHDFIVALPDGYETVIGERGLTLSGGQRQRVSIARTILQDPRILILDEATSSLDSESENLINEALDHVTEGRTSLIIAHRLSTVISADWTLVFKEGALVEQGRHEDLLSEGGYYQYLFEEQFGKVRELLDNGET